MWTSEVRAKGSSGHGVGLNAICQAGLGQLDPKRDHGLAHGRPGTVQIGFGRCLDPERTWWTSHVRGKGSSGPGVGLNAICEAGLGKLDPKWDHGLAHRHPGTVQSEFGRILGPGRDGPQSFGVRGPVVSCLVLTQCLRWDWDNWAQNGIMVLPMGTLEGCKAGFIDFQILDGRGGPQRSEGRGPAVTGLVLTQCVRQDWDNWNQNETMALPMEALEQRKAGLVDF